MRFFKRRRQEPPDPLDVPLHEWGPGDPFKIRDAMASIFIAGRSGSGKTRYSGRTIMRGMVNNRKSGGLILGAQQNDISDVRRIFAECGRRDDLVVMGEDGEIRINYLDTVRRIGGGTRETTRFITTMGENLHASHLQGGEESGFFKEQEERTIYNAVEVVKHGTGTVTAPDLQKFIVTALQSPDQVKSSEWHGCFHDKCMRAAFQKPKSIIEQYDFDLAVDFWFKQWPLLAPKTRSCILAGILGTLHVFNSGLPRQLISTTTNFDVRETLEGRWLYVNLAPAHFGDVGTIINCGAKYLIQLLVLKRKASPNDCFNIIWADEFQQFANSLDSYYLAQCRQHLGGMVVLTQSIHGILAAMSGETGKHQALGLLTNFGHKVWHAVGDAETAEYASSLLGKQLQTFIGGSMAPEESMFDAMMGRSRFTPSFSEHYEYVVQPKVFMSGLRTGGKESNYIADAIVIRSGEPFRNGANWRYATFSQK